MDLPSRVVELGELGELGGVRWSWVVVVGGGNIIFRKV